MFVQVLLFTAVGGRPKSPVGTETAASSVELVLQHARSSAAIPSCNLRWRTFMCFSSVNSRGFLFCGII